MLTFFSTGRKGAWRDEAVVSNGGKLLPCSALIPRYSSCSEPAMCFFYETGGGPSGFIFKKR